MYHWKPSIIFFAVSLLPNCLSAQSAQIMDSLFVNGEYEEVISIYENASQQFQENKVLAKVGQAYYFLNSYQNCIKILTPVLQSNIFTNSHFDAYVNGYYLSWSHKRLNQLDSAIQYSKLALSNAHLTKSKTNIGRAYHNLAILYSDIGDYTNSILNDQHALEFKKGDTSLYMQTRCNMSQTYFKIGILDSALNIASEVYNYFRIKPVDNYWKWRSTYQLAYIEKDYKNELSKSYYKEILSFTDNEYRQNLAEVGLAKSYLMDKNDSAMFYFEIAQENAERINNSSLLSEVNFTKARIHLELKPNQILLREAIIELNRIFAKDDDHRGIPLLRLLESKYYLNENREDSSLYFINQAISIAREFNQKDRLSEALTQKFNVLNHFGRYKEALAVKEEEIKVQQELFNDRSEAVYQILRTQNEMDKQESTIANQQLEIDNNNLQITIMYISIALVVSALVFIFWQYRTRSKYAQKLETMFLDSRHRYMNNLLLLKNWFNEGKTEKNDEIISFAQNRIDAISTVNRHLDRLSYNKNTIESKSFLEDISHNLLANREFTSEIENVPINMSVSGPLGMITNEIITNGLKYGEEPYAIRFQKNGNGYVLEIEDHGPGIADPEKKGTGSKVLRLLSRQLKGELIYQNKADHSDQGRGTLVSLNFKG